MTWFKVDDTAAMHPKMVAAGNPALGLWLRCGSWSASLLTDGFIPGSMIALFAGRPVDVRRLVQVGLWNDIPGGYQLTLDDGLWRFPGPWREPIAPSLRAAVYARDQYRCRSCGTHKRLELDHIHPCSLGGRDTLANLQTLCRSCNASKGARISG